jgi:hypothetical protein
MFSDDNFQGPHCPDGHGNTMISNRTGAPKLFLPAIRRNRRTVSALFQIARQAPGD